MECDIKNDVNCQMLYAFCKSIYINFIPYVGEFENIDNSLFYIEYINNWAQFCNTTLNDYLLDDKYLFSLDSIPSDEVTIYQETSDYTTRLSYGFQIILTFFLLFVVIKTNNEIGEKIIAHLIQLISAMSICYWGYFHNNGTFFFSNIPLILFEIVICMYLIRMRIYDFNLKPTITFNEIISS